MRNEARRNVVVGYTADFVADIKSLRRRFSHIQLDVQPILARLATGETLGDQMPGIGYPVFKVRILNRDLKKGKNAGYRLIYWIKSPESVDVLTIYAKSDRIDISANEVRSIIERQMENPS